MFIHAPWRGVLLLVACALPICGCVATPPARPLDPDALLATVRAARAEAETPADRPLTLAEATALMRAANPSIREARAAWHVADSIARTKTPMPNPVVSLGPLFFGQGNILQAATTGFAGGLGWTTPIADPPRLADDLNRVRAGAAFARAAAAERSAYLDLRAQYARAVLALEGEVIGAAVLEATTAALEASRRMVDAGQGTALDVQLLEVQRARVRTTTITARGASRQARYAMAAILGLDPERVQLAGATLPTLPEVLPALESIERAATSGHPRLDELRAEYLVAERVLRQEAARANPSVDIGLTFERTQPSNELGLPLGIELPIFDRNQVGLAGALAERDAVRERYLATLSRLLGDIATAYAGVEAHMETLGAIENDVLPATERAVAFARAEIEAGTAEALHFLATVTARADVELERFEALTAVRAAWAALERAAGVPLLDWPDAIESTVGEDD
ncbi:MAG: TolC family protein [Planctomycetota bacterium]|nr:TolC family protein [Planctomycetota bacterium]